MNELYKCKDNLFSMSNKTWLFSICLVFHHNAHYQLACLQLRLYLPMLMAKAN